MRATWIIFSREIGHYFTSPIAYLITAAFLLLTGVLFNGDLAFSVGIKAVEPALIPAFLSLMLIFFAPLLTMRLLAEEGREGTLELLLTAPVTDNQIVLGKFLSAWFYYSLLLAATFLYQFILAAISTPDMAHTIGAYIGIWLYGGAALAIGLLFSATTENQIVAAFLSMAVLLILWFGDLSGQIIPNAVWANIIRQLSLAGHFSTSFAVGLIRLEDVAFYAGIIVIALFITMRIVESQRWR